MARNCELSIEINEYFNVSANGIVFCSSDSQFAKLIKELVANNKKLGYLL